jgi:hypothetical protein
LVSLIWERLLTVLKSLRNFKFYLWLILKIVIFEKSIQRLNSLRTSSHFT